ncbi:kynurenine formamidase [Leptopilina boulardi]|uniref:kynurenine formamidase n=1 Tax=Leptopilina boulardi TaxID=63433 RepID=UPI0021F684FA|nr:kynurenine formamidase [Leptopilina boulardi]
MAQSENEKLYWPSCWSKRWDSDKLLEHYFKKCEEIISKARSSISCELDIPYGTTERTKFDIYGTNLPKDAPIFIFIHGGYWMEFTKDLSGFPVSSLVSQGIKVIVCGYDLCPNVSLTEIVLEIKIFVEKILKDAHAFGTRKIWIAGHSAGAHLAASLLHDKNWLNSMTEKGYRNLLKGLILIAGVYDLKPLLTTSMNDALKLTPQEVKLYSFAPIEQNDSLTESTIIQDLKVIVTVGECDSPVFIKESIRYSQKLVEFVDNVEFLLLRNNIDHFDIVENLVHCDFQLTKLILQHIK